MRVSASPSRGVDPAPHHERKCRSSAVSGFEVDFQTQIDVLEGLVPIPLEGEHMSEVDRRESPAQPVADPFLDLYAYLHNQYTLQSNCRINDMALLSFFYSFFDPGNYD